MKKTEAAVEKIMESLSVVESVLSNRIPDLERAVVALTSVVGELENKIAHQDSLIALLIAESPTYKKYLEDANDSNAETEAIKPTPKAGSKSRGKIAL